MSFFDSKYISVSVCASTSIPPLKASYQINEFLIDILISRSHYKMKKKEEISTEQYSHNYSHIVYKGYTYIASSAHLSFHNELSACTLDVWHFCYHVIISYARGKEGKKCLCQSSKDCYFLLNEIPCLTLNVFVENLSLYYFFFFLFSFYFLSLVYFYMY